MRHASLRRLGLLLFFAAASTSAASTDALLRAAQANDHSTALALVRENADVTAVQPDGTTALHWAARYNDAELVGALLAAGADASARNRYGVSPMYLAAESGSPGIVEMLLDAGADPNETGNLGETILMTTAHTGMVGAAEILLDRGAAIDAREEWHGQTALMWAAGYSHPDMIGLLAERGADVNAVSALEEWERQTTAEPRAKWLPPGALTPMHFAAREGCTECIPVLVEAGADVDAVSPEGISPLVMALINGHYDSAAALIEAGAEANLYDEDGRGPLYAAIDFNTMPASNRPPPYVLQNEHTALDIAKMLIERGADVNAKLKRLPPYRSKIDRGNDGSLSGGTTPLMRAAKAGDLEGMQVLIDAGADVSMATDRAGITPVLFAAGVGTAEQDTTGRYKSQANAIAAIDLLVESGADIHAVDSRGHNALHGAALQGYNDVIRHLASKGVDLTAEDRSGYTPLDTALGLAGGFGFTGQEGVVREDTAAIIRELIEQESGAERTAAAN